MNNTFTPDNNLIVFPDKLVSSIKKLLSYIKNEEVLKIGVEKILDPLRKFTWRRT